MRRKKRKRFWEILTNDRGYLISINYRKREGEAGYVENVSILNEATSSRSLFADFGYCVFVL